MCLPREGLGPSFPRWNVIFQMKPQIVGIKDPLVLKKDT
jgi:hypothetical protein